VPIEQDGNALRNTFEHPLIEVDAMDMTESPLAERKEMGNALQPG